MQDFAPFIPEFLGALSRPPAVKGAEPFARINLPATFQFSPATSKSIDIPEDYCHCLPLPCQISAVDIRHCNELPEVSGLLSLYIHMAIGGLL